MKDQRRTVSYARSGPRNLFTITERMNPGTSLETGKIN